MRLNQAVSYANKFYAKNKKPFYLAITDHDSANGCKEALKIITQEPKKFSHLKLVLGDEVTSSFKNPYSQAKKVDLLTYCITPDGGYRITQ